MASIQAKDKKAGRSEEEEEEEIDVRVSSLDNRTVRWPRTHHQKEKMGESVQSVSIRLPGQIFRIYVCEDQYSTVPFCRSHITHWGVR